VCKYERQCAVNSKDVKLYIMCVSGDDPSVKFINAQFFIVTSQGINVLRGCMHFVLLVKIHVKPLPKSYPC
jgi:hypothetical protein